MVNFLLDRYKYLLSEGSLFWEEKG